MKDKKLTDENGRIEIEPDTLESLRKLLKEHPGKNARIHIAGFG